MNLESITFLDIETVPYKQGLDGEKDETAIHYQRRFRNDIRLIVDETFQEHYQANAGLYAEFGKIVCIAIGKINQKKVDEQTTEPVFYVKTIVGEEKEILEQLAVSLEKSGSLKLCAHNGKEFDFPFLMRKYIIHGLPIPKQLSVIGKKPWETQLEDTMEMWSGTQWKYRVSLDLLAHLFGIPSSKSDITGADVGRLYYSGEEGSMKKIADYCAGDVVVLSRIFARMMNLEITDKVEYL